MRKTEVEWLEPSAVGVDAGVLAAAGENQLLAEALTRRGLQSRAQADAFLDPDHYTPSNPFDLPGMDVAVRRILDAVQGNQKIGIWGDFDVDGQTATAVLKSAIQQVGGQVETYIPLRAGESHGINLPGLERFLKKEISLLVSCDTGITASDSIVYAKDRGVDCIITDHHTISDGLPPALAVIHPQRLPAGHPMGTLCGAGVAFMLVRALAQRTGNPVDQPLIDLAALGTLADQAILLGENRFLVQKGLQAIRQQPRPALAAIFSLAGADYTQISDEHINFLLVPRLNALGRLGDANPAVDFLLSEDVNRVNEFAQQLETLNAQRKLLCDQVFKAALAQIELDRSLQSGPALVLDHPAWPGGVLGIVASRLAEWFHRPVILLASPPGQVVRGSARSIEGINVTSAIAECQNLLVTFGGHPMAAGLSLDPQQLPEFRSVFFRAIEKQAGERALRPTIQIEQYLSLEEVNLELVQTIDRLAPNGPGNPPMLLASRGLALKSHSPIGKTGEHLQLIVEGPSGETRKVLWWQGAGFPLPENRFDLAFTLRASNYRGQREVQIEWVAARPLEEAPQLRTRRAAVKSLDFRHEAEPQKALAALQKEGNLLTWQEGTARKVAGGRDRFNVAPCSVLAIWSIPPGLAELRTVLDLARPQKVAFFGLHPSTDQPVEFLKLLGGMLRHAIQARAGQVSIHALAAATAQREVTVLKGIEWWQARGQIMFLTTSNGEYQFSEKGQPDLDHLAVVDKELAYLLKETAAFRAYYLRADPSQLLE